MGQGLEVADFTSLLGLIQSTYSNGLCYLVLSFKCRILVSLGSCGPALVKEGENEL